MSGELCKNLEFQRFAQDVDTVAEEESLKVLDHKGNWRQGNVRNGPE